MPRVTTKYGSNENGRAQITATMTWPNGAKAVKTVAYDHEKGRVSNHQRAVDALADRFGGVSTGALEETKSGRGFVFGIDLSGEG